MIPEGDKMSSLEMITPMTDKQSIVLEIESSLEIQINKMNKYNA